MTDDRTAQRQSIREGVERICSRFDPASAAPSLGALTTGELARRRAEVADELERAEQCWLAASERLERQSA